jgi:hypothetical protein
MPTEEFEPEAGAERLLMTTLSILPYFLKISFYIREKKKSKLFKAKMK